MHASDLCNPTVARVGVDRTSHLRRTNFGKRKVAVTIVSTKFRGISGVRTVGGVGVLNAHSFIGPRTSVCTRDDRKVSILSYVTVGRPGIVVNATPRTSC